MGSRCCYRYRTTVLAGPWRRRPDQALEDAVMAGQARRDEEDRVVWKVDGTIERSECRSGSPCRGKHPPE